MVDLFIVVRGEQSEGYEIVQVFTDEVEAFYFAEKLKKEIVVDCDYVEIIDIVDGKPLN